MFSGNEPPPAYGAPHTPPPGDPAGPYGAPHQPAPLNLKGSGGLKPMRLLFMVLRRWYVPVIFGVLGILVGIIRAIFAVPVYQAKAEIEMSIQRPQFIQTEVNLEEGGGTLSEDVIFNTRFAKFGSPAMEEIASEVYFSKYSKEEYLQRTAWSGVQDLAYWVRQVGWYKQGNANIVHVSFRCPDPEFAAQLVNVMIESAGLLMERDNKELSDGAVKWLVDQTEVLRKELEGVELELADKRQAFQITTLEQRRESLGAILADLEAQKAGLENQLALRQTEYNYLSEWEESGRSIETLPTGLPKEQQLYELLGTWQTALDEFQRVSEKYTQKHPRYQEAKRAEERALARLDQFIEVSWKAIQNELTLLKTKIGQMQGRVVKIETELRDLDKKIADGKRKLLKLERKRDTAEASYRSVLQRTENTRLAAEQDTAFVKVLREAAVPRIPIAPDKKKIVIITVFLFGVLGAGLAVAMEFLMNRVGSVTDLKDLGLHVLGILPRESKYMTRADIAKSGIVDSFGAMVEVFVGINGYILSEKFKEQSEVLMVSSAGPGEGKTISSCNLAISLARNGLKTLLIDADLRRPQVGNIFEIPSEHPSLLEWLSSRHEGMEHRQLVSHNMIENLDVITSRPLKNVNPAEMLGRKELAELVEWARSEYDRVIIDTPPIGPVGDGVVLASYVDSVIVVSRVGKTNMRSLKSMLSRLLEVDVLILGCIANDVPYSLAGKFSGAEGYGYGHSYKSYVSDTAE
ncbi:polysaccharide biosynthesis tyrosine autokinase [Pontiella agarivorans]|uniref:Polysaccharide biosynthesis tyrosine autokinase n=1 Tax=Pontiella agarivorans TaxID=3038953 RepID=A0ABU5MUF3_9BACT|nr:polysaccharide biosynthesis tyrosine autokinase [Pontiella agarivorans]MDZ8117763.1 polysaccharide biosynthesis tyrosine autokinase [Pontiella agarivorans]